MLASSSLKTNQAHHCWNINFSCLYTQYIINLFKCQQQTSSRFPSLHTTSLYMMWSYCCQPSQLVQRSVIQTWSWTHPLKSLMLKCHRVFTGGLTLLYQECFFRTFTGFFSLLFLPLWHKKHPVKARIMARCVCMWLGEKENSCIHV